MSDAIVSAATSTNTISFWINDFRLCFMVSPAKIQKIFCIYAVSFDVLKFIERQNELRVVVLYLFERGKLAVDCAYIGQQICKLDVQSFALTFCDKVNFKVVNFADVDGVSTCSQFKIDDVFEEP